MPCWDWNSPDLPPLIKIFGFVEATVVKRIPLEQWKGRVLASRPTARRYLRAARWIGLVDGEMRNPGGWVEGPNLDLIRDSNGSYHSSEIGIIVESNDLFQYAFKLVGKYNKGQPIPRWRTSLIDEMAHHMSTVRTRLDGKKFSDRTLRTCSGQIINWAIDISHQREWRFFGFG